MLIGSALSSSLTWLWLGLAVVFAIIEAVTLGIVSIWFAIGALVAMLFAFVIDSFMIQLVIFLAVSLLLVFTTRKIGMERLRIGKEKTNLDSLIGQSALVTKEINPFEPGEIKVDGKMWRAVSQSDTVYVVGNKVEVLKIEGVTMILK